MPQMTENSGAGANCGAGVSPAYVCFDPAVPPARASALAAPQISSRLRIILAIIASAAILLLGAYVTIGGTPPVVHLGGHRHASPPRAHGPSGYVPYGPVSFGPYGPGEYVGHERFAHVPVYRLRVDDQLECLYRLTREETAQPYQLNVGDEIQVESVGDPNVNRNLIVQPDGTITLRLLGQVKATGHTIQQLRDKLEDLYQKYTNVPAITVTPLKVNTRLEDLRPRSITAQASSAGRECRSASRPMERSRSPPSAAFWRRASRSTS